MRRDSRKDQSRPLGGLGGDGDRIESQVRGSILHTLWQSQEGLSYFEQRRRERLVLAALLAQTPKTVHDVVRQIDPLARLLILRRGVGCLKPRGRLVKNLRRCISERTLREAVVA